VPELIELQMAPPDEQDEIGARVQEIFLQRSRDEWVRELAELDACVGPVNDFAEAFADPQVLARGLRVDVPTTEGPAGAVGNPIRAVGEDQGDLGAPPGFGEHTDEVLRAAGYGDAEIEALRATGTV
jgi:crotonobetainyl-CoA:carnitine CoA-transferase CaiB-like acyl-CoA transferase